MGSSIQIQDTTTTKTEGNNDNKSGNNRGFRSWIQKQFNYDFASSRLAAVGLPTICLGLSLGSLIICTFLGNLLVILAILTDRSLQNPSNLLVLSLAVADMLVACLVMPLGAYNEIMEGWFLGTRLCQFWTVADVSCCTGKLR